MDSPADDSAPLAAADYPRQVVPIFSGGGTRLSAHAGILQALNDLEINFDHIVGVSGGSIVASLFATGMPLNAIKKLTIATDFNQFRHFSVWRLLMEGGLNSGNKLQKWLDKKLDSKTFSDIDHTLHILATDINGGGPIVFNRSTTPNMQLSEAIRYSISIPLIFSFKTYQKHILTDGAILSEDAIFRNWAGDQTPTLCFRLKSEPKADSEYNKPFIPLKSYILMLTRTFMNAVSREYVHSDHWHNTIVVNTGQTSAVDFNLNETQKLTLYNTGYQTAVDWIPIKFSRHNLANNSPTNYQTNTNGTQI